MTVENVHDRTTPEHKADVTQNCKEKRKREMAVEHEDQRKAEEETEEQPTCKKQVSKPLLDTLWTKFKANEGFTARDSFALAFQFDLTAKQVHQWFCNMRQEYKKEIRKLKYKKRYRNKRK
ncbi:NANOG neighbor homeobox [Suncus etruscus]|uniref:NANOG neighbor homeobox n=1 Tax=Suncus etruscus TaxID=109475 RepID=UPI0021107301|nr:NANOG neighbor homeobox [Suncus etruscus]